MRTAAALALALVALTVGMEVVDEVSAEGDLASMAMLQEASAANMAKTGGLYQYRPDGLNDVELSAIANLRTANPEDYAVQGLGESDDEVLREFSTHKQHQPIKNLGKWGGKEMCLIMVNDDRCRFTKGKVCKLALKQCLSPTGWFYNRFTKRIEAPETSTKGEIIQKCLTRRYVRGDKKPSIIAGDCNDGPHQLWEYQCQAFTYLQDAGKKTEAIRVLTANKDNKNIEVDKYYSESEQLWYLHEVVRHSRCRTKRYKVMKFRGSLATTVVLKNFVSMPTTGVTVQFWMKGDRGTPFSYASDGVPNPPYQTQIAVNIPKKDAAMTIDLFDVEFKTGIYPPQHKWFNVAVSWDKTFGQLKMYHDGKLVWSKNTQAVKSKTGKPPFSRSEFVASGCLMLGQKAKRPCKQRIASSSYRGELADLLVHKGVLNVQQIQEAMYKPVDPVYLATIQEDAPTNRPNTKLLRVAYLTRQYGSQELNQRYPPVCQLKAENRLSITNQAGGGPNWAQLCEARKKSPQKNPLTGGHLSYHDCFMKFYGHGDVHYRTFGGCYYDDQSVGEYVAVAMKPEYYKLHPLMIQYLNAPYQGNAPWSQHQWRTINGRRVKLPPMLSFVDGCAIKFKTERFAIGFGGYRYNFGGERSKYAPYADFTDYNGNTRAVCDNRREYFHPTCRGRSPCQKSKYFNGWCHRSPSRRYGSKSGSAYITMEDGLKLRCWRVGMEMYIPRKLENKIMGMGGAQGRSVFYGRAHGGSRNNVQTKYEWTVGTNRANVKELNEKWNAKTMANRKAPGNVVRNPDQVSTYDMEPMVVGKQVPGLAHPRDSPNGHYNGGGKAGGRHGSCRVRYQYPFSASPYNGNRAWKGIAKMMSSWSVDDDNIPSIFGGVSKKVAVNKWNELSPAFGVSKNRPKGAKELAQKGCQSVKPFKKAFADCVFDFMALGPTAAKKNLKSRAKTRAGKSKKPTLKAVRDATGSANHAVWVGHPSWGCVDEFSVHVTAMAKEHMARKFRNSKKAAMCKCQHKYLGVCAFDHFICIADVELNNKPRKQIQ